MGAKAAGLGGLIGWGLLTLLAVAFIASGIWPIVHLGYALLALCLLKAGLKVSGHAIGGGPRRRLRFGSKKRPPGKETASGS